MRFHCVAQVLAAMPQSNSLLPVSIIAFDNETTSDGLWDHMKLCADRMPGSMAPLDLRKHLNDPVPELRVRRGQNAEFVKTQVAIFSQDAFLDTVLAALEGG